VRDPDLHGRRLTKTASNCFEFSVRAGVLEAKNSWGKTGNLPTFSGLAPENKPSMVVTMLRAAGKAARRTVRVGGMPGREHSLATAPRLFLHDGITGSGRPLPVMLCSPICQLRT
jgi:hypothetical protein